ncbi:MAG: hypothetical protein R3275_08785 [Saprospiraceae bacterium]|nr:hypothetical protein [Saprospiraceae bacterium]
MRNIIFSAIILFSVNLLFSQSTDRNVAWLPGFTGDVSQWAIYAPYYQNERQIESHTVGFGLGAIDRVTEDVYDDIENELGDGSRDEDNICVGYSTGGLVGRNVERLHDGEEQNFGGVITLHCPNQGTVLAENFIKGDAQNIMINYIDKLLEPVNKDPALTLTEIIIAFPFLSKHVNFSQFLNIIQIIFAGDGEAAFRELADIGGLNAFARDPQKVNDLRPGSDFIRDLTDFNSSALGIDIYGSEEPDLFYRLMSSFLAMPASRPMHEITDEELDNAIRSLGSLFQVNSHIRRAQAIIQDINPLRSGSKNHSRARAWSNGRDELENQAQNNWLRAIGALTLEKIVAKEGKRLLTPLCRSKLEFLNEQLKLAIQDPNYDPGPLYQRIAELENNPDCYYYDHIIHYKWILRDSDSFLLVEDQRLSGAYASYKNERVNHAEAINHSETTENFDRIWDRQVGDFFRTETR